MKSRIITLAIVLSVAGQAAARANSINVALGKTVSLSSGINGSASLLTDGVFVPRGTQWQSGTLWWQGTTPSLEVDLGGFHTLTGFIVQADDNDAYRLDYWNGSVWAEAWAIPNYDNYGWGMQTRPNPDDHSAQFILNVPIVAAKLRLSATSGDNAYSVSELQAFGRAAGVPDQVSTFGLLATVLAGFAAWRRRAAR